MAVKSGNTRYEQMTSAVLPEADIYPTELGANFAVRRVATMTQRATILLRIDWLSDLIGALLWVTRAAEARFGVLPCRVICSGGAEVVRRMVPHKPQRIP